MTVEQELVKELNLLPNYADPYFMKVWNALVEERERCNEHERTLKRCEEILGIEDES